MKEITCEIIRDILPLYVDEAVSRDTKELVEEHLFTCEACREEAEMMKKTMILPVHKSVRNLDQEILKKWRNKWLTKKVIIAVVSICATLGVAAGVYSAMVLPELFIPYDEEKFQIVEESGKLYAEYLGDCYDGTEAIAPIEVNVNGEKQTIVCFSYYDSPWSRYLEPKIVSEKNRAETDKRCFLGETGKIDQVYYGEFDIEDMVIKEQSFHEQLSSLLDDMELIYETD